MDTAELARRIRMHALRMTSDGKSSHIGAILSMADIVGVLYGTVMRLNPQLPNCPHRDRFILSKGHAGAGVYAALAETGFISRDKLQTHYQNGSALSGHISHKDNPGVELSTGSLGHGLPVASGMAYAGKLRNSSHRVFVLLGDGECDEGSNWEAILFASHHRLTNLTAVVDYNKIQSLGPVSDTIGLEPFPDKWRSFGWEVLRCDGHNHAELAVALTTRHDSRPTCVIADTTKGKGVSFMENSVLWHYRVPQDEEFDRALAELKKAGS